MNGDERAAAIAYLMPSADAFWTYSQDGEAIEWRGGVTIAFLPELEAVLERLADRPLPPLDAMLTVLAALRDSWDELCRHRLTEFFHRHHPANDSVAAGKRVAAIQPREDWQSEIHAGLQRLHELPPDLRHRATVKAEIVAIVFEDSVPAGPLLTGRIVLDALYRRLHTLMWDGEKSDAPAHVWQSPLPAMRRLRDGLKRIDPTTLRQRLATGLDVLPEPAPVALTPAQQVRALLTSLESDVELSGVARLARQLTAAVLLRRPLQNREELPLGGVTDISNRGSLDRLLLSELAHDGTMLAVRIAMNEALYLRREPPARNQARERVVLLDVGLRMWGVPRVFAAAVGLALAATTEQQVKAQVYRAEGDQLVRVDLKTKTGLIAHLGALATTLHPADALEALAAEVDKLADGVDVVLITSDDTLADPAFARALAECRLDNFYVASVNREGRFELLEYTAYALKSVQTVTLSLDVLLPDAPRRRPLIDTSRSGNVPAIFHVQPFPLLLSAHLDHEQVWKVPGYGLFMLSRDGRLLHWSVFGRGGRQLAIDLPPGALHWCETTPRSDRKICAVIGKLSQRGLRRLTIDLDSNTCEVHALETSIPDPKIVAGYQGVIFVIGRDHVEAVSVGSGQSLGSVLIPDDLTSTRGRYFVGAAIFRNWWALAHDGQGPRFEQILLPTGRSWVSMSDSPHGPIGVTNEGAVFHFKDSLFRLLDGAFPSNVWVMAVSRDGCRLILKSADGKQRLVHIDQKETQPVTWPTSKLEEVDDAVQMHEMRKHFVQIASLPEGTLALRSSRGQWFSLRFDPSVKCLGLVPLFSDPEERLRRTFSSLQNGPSRTCKLSVATWTDGSQAWLDARGLLHLRSSDASVPDVTIVLSATDASAWLSDGRTVGSPYFLDGEPSLRRREFLDQIIKPLVGRMQC